MKNDFYKMIGAISLIMVIPQVILGADYLHIFINVLCAVLFFAYNDRKNMLILSILAIFGSVIPGVLGIVTYYKDKRISNGDINNNDPNFEKMKQLNLVLFLGVCLVSLSAIIFSVNNWHSFSGLIKVFFFISISILFGGLSIFAKNKIKIKTTSLLYWVVSSILFYVGIISLLSLEFMTFISDYYEVFISMTISLIVLFTYIIYKNNILKEILIYFLICILLQVGDVLNVYSFLILGFLICSFIGSLFNKSVILKNILYLMSILNIVSFTAVTSFNLINIIQLVTLIITIIATNVEWSKNGKSIIIPMLFTYLGFSYYILHFNIGFENLLIIIGALVLLLYVSNYILKYKEGIITNNLVANLVLCLLAVALLSYEFYYLLFIVLIMFIIYIFNKSLKNDKSECEKILLVPKISLLIIAIFKAIIFFEISFSFNLLLIISATILLLLSFIYKNESLKKILLYGTFILAFMNIINFPASLLEYYLKNNLIFNIYSFIISIIAVIKLKKFSSNFEFKLILVSMFVLLIKLYNTLYIINNEVSLYYLLILLLTGIYIYFKEDRILSVIIIGLFGLPIIEIIKHLGDSVNTLVIMATYLLILANVIFYKLIGYTNTRSIFKTAACIVYGYILIQNSSLESIISVYIIGIILLLDSILISKTKNLRYASIVILLVNLFNQLIKYLDFIPVWFYMLIAGLIIISIVTVKIFKQDDKIEKEVVVSKTEFCLSNKYINQLWYLIGYLFILNIIIGGIL